MCLAVPCQIVSIREQGRVADLDLLGNRTNADISLLSDAQVGDYVLVHAGFAIQKYDLEEAQLTLSLIQEMLAKNNCQVCSEVKANEK